MLYHNCDRAHAQAWANAYAHTRIELALLAHSLYRAKLIYSTVQHHLMGTATTVSGCLTLLMLIHI